MQLKHINVEEFEEIWDRVDLCMHRYARANGFEDYKDFEVYWPYNGWSQILIELLNLEMLTGRLVAKLRRQVKDRPGWEVVVAILVDEHLDDWPKMGLRIRAHEVVDDLKREYLPPKYQPLRFEGGRPGTASD